MPSLPLHIKAFNDKVRTLNQTNSRTLTLTADEARNLHAEIFSMLTEIARLSGSKEPTIKSVEMDGGKF